MVGQASTVAHAVARVPAMRPNVAVLDVRLPDGSGVELCRELLSRFPDLRCLMLSSFPEEQAMMGAFLAGAAGFVIKDITGVDLVAAVRMVGTGRCCWTRGPPPHCSNGCGRPRRRQVHWPG